MSEKLQTTKTNRSDDKLPAKSKAAVAAEPGGMSSRIERVRSFFEEALAELKKVTWPTRKDTLRAGLAVLMLVAVMTIFLGAIDAILSRLIGWLISL